MSVHIQMNKVLVLYLEINKVVKIPEEENDTLSYLKTKFENEEVSVLFLYYSRSGRNMWNLNYLMLLTMRRNDSFEMSRQDAVSH